MAIDFLIRASCPIQDGMKMMEVCDISKLRDLIQYFTENKEDIIADHPGMAFEEIPSRMNRNGEVTETTFGEIQRRWNHYEAIGEKCCPECKVNFRRRVIGCYGAINYPMSAEFETWLMKNYNPAPDTPDLLWEMMTEHGIDGSRLDSERGQIGEHGFPSLIEAAEPVKKYVSHLDTEISSSQIIECLMGIEKIRIDFSWSLLRSFGVVGGETEVLDEITKIVLGPPPEGSGIVMGFERFLGFDRYNGVAVDKDGKVTSWTSMDLPLSMSSKERVERFEELIGKIKVIMKPGNTEDRVIAGFVRFLVANLVALRTRCAIDVDA